VLQHLLGSVNDARGPYDLSIRPPTGIPVGRLGAAGQGYWPASGYFQRQSYKLAFGFNGGFAWGRPLAQYHSTMAMSVVAPEFFCCRHTKIRPICTEYHGRPLI